MALTLRAQRWGKGPRTVVLLHGFTGSAASWTGVAPALAESFRICAVDLPGHGASPPPPSGVEGFQSTIGALADLLDEEGPASLVGYSMGARLALAVAIEHPSRVESLVLESGCPGIEDEAERAQRRSDDELLARKLETDGLEAFLRDWERLPLFDGLRRAPQVVQDELRARRRLNDPARLAASLRGNGTGIQPSYMSRLSELRVPALLITGACDAKFAAIAERMAARLPNASHLTLPTTWHCPHLEAPQAWSRAVLSFLQSPDSPRSAK